MTIATALQGRSRRLPATATVGALVVGGDYQGLGVVRSLGRRGIPTAVLDDERSIAGFSRYARHSVRVPQLRDEGVIVEALLDTGRRLGLEGWVLYPTREEVVAAISRHRAELGKLFRVPTPDWDVVRHLWDKRRTYQLAEELGLAVPRTWYPQDLAALDQVGGDGPFAIKPAVKEHFIYQTGDKAWRADDRTELHRLFARAAALLPPGEVMVQELVPGDGRQQFAYCALFKDGAARTSMVVCRRRQHPLEFGRASTFVETVDLPELEAASELLLRAIGYHGLVEVEYKRDPRDGQYKLLDVNARTWGYHSLGAAAGVDFAALLFLEQLGQDLPMSRARVGVRWVRLLTDLPTGLLELRDGRVSWPEYWRSLRGCDTEAVFSRDDPLPGAVELGLLPYLIVKRGF